MINVDLRSAFAKEREANFSLVRIPKVDVNRKSSSNSQQFHCIDYDECRFEECTFQGERSHSFGKVPTRIQGQIAISSRGVR